MLFVNVVFCDQGRLHCLVPAAEPRNILPVAKESDIRNRIISRMLSPQDEDEPTGCRLARMSGTRRDCRTLSG